MCSVEKRPVYQYLLDHAGQSVPTHVLVDAVERQLSTYGTTKWTQGHVDVKLIIRDAPLQSWGIPRQQLPNAAVWAGCIGCVGAGCMHGMLHGT
jgi:hypothetical protein